MRPFWSSHRSHSRPRLHPSRSHPLITSTLLEDKLADSTFYLSLAPCSTQTISGTGANHLGALFLAKFYPFPSAQKKIYISNPTWANHPAIFKNVGIEPMLYRYYNKESVGLDFEGFKEDLGEAEEGSVFLIHACAHNVRSFPYALLFVLLEGEGI